MPCKSTPNLLYYTMMQTGELCPKGVGKPGCGKSESAEAFARAMGRQCFTLVGSLLEPTDFAIPYVVNHEGLTFMRPWRRASVKRRLSSTRTGSNPWTCRTLKIGFSMPSSAGRKVCLLPTSSTSRPAAIKSWPRWVL